MPDGEVDELDVFRMKKLGGWHRKMNQLGGT